MSVPCFPDFTFGTASLASEFQPILHAHLVRCLSTIIKWTFSIVVWRLGVVSPTEYTNCIILQISPHQQPLTSTPMPLSSGVGMTPPDKSLADTEKVLNESQMALRELQAEYNTYRKEKMENEK